MPAADMPPPAPPAPNDLAGQISVAIAQLKEWTGFGVDQTNRLDQANGRTEDAIGIVRRCEARDQQAVKQARPKVLGIF